MAAALHHERLLMERQAGQQLALLNHRAVRADERQQGAYYVGQAGQVIYQQITLVQPAEQRPYRTSDM